VAIGRALANEPVLILADEADDFLITVRRNVESVAGERAMVLARKPQ
jgi:ABC-type molybdate transport system ATPase subunit